MSVFLSYRRIDGPYALWIYPWLIQWFGRDIVHQVSASVTVQKLEAEVTTPQGLNQRFKWNVFYDFRPSNQPEGGLMTKVSDAGEIEIEAGCSSLGIQFLGPALESDQLWEPGVYKFELDGWINKRSGDDRFDTKTSFAVEIGDYEAGQVKYWSRASKSVWDQLNDPDRAVAIPVGIEVDV
jgi:hypothetical protein